MNTVPALHFQDFISADGDTLTTTSHQVAAVFGRRHADVIRAIEALRKDLPESHQRIFALVMESMTYVDSEGTRAEMATSRVGHFKITRDGFTLLAMGFTGKKALAFKLAYIDAFNAMAAYLKNQREGLRYQCIRKELECADSARRGSFHGRGLNERRQEKPRLEAELADLRAKAQPEFPELMH